MKQVRVVKWLLFAFVVLLMPTAWADILPPPEPLRRIGYEILVEVAAAAGGTIVLRHLAGKFWKGPWEVTKSELDEIEAKIEAVLPALQEKLDEAYERKSKEWLAADKKLIAEAERFSLRRFLWRLFHPTKYRHEKEVKRYWQKCRAERNYMWNIPVGNAWHTLCHDLLFEILEGDTVLREKCKGIPIELLSDKMIQNNYHFPDEYQGVYAKEGHGLGYNAVLAIVRSLPDRRIAVGVQNSDNSHLLPTDGIKIVRFGGEWELQVTGGLGGEEVAFPNDRPILVGRSHVADVRVQNTDISGRHLEISITSCGPQVKVLSFRGATTVDGKELAQGDIAMVSDGSEILLGIKSSVKVVVKSAPKPLPELINNDNAEA